MAELLDLTTRRLRQLAVDGVIPESERGKGYPVVKTVQGYVAYLRGEATGRGGPAKAEHRTARATKETYQAELARLDYEERIRKLAPKDEVDEQLDIAMDALVRILGGIGGRLAGTLAGLDDPATIKEAIDGEVTRARLAAAKRLAGLGGAPARKKTKAKAKGHNRKVGRKKARPAR